MQRIHFANLKRNKFLGVLILVSALLALAFVFELISFENPKWNKYFLALAYLSNAIFISQMFWYKNYVQWSKRGILIKVKSWSSKNLKFEDITAIALENDILKITRHGDMEVFDMNHIVAEDRNKLFQIIQEHTKLVLK